MIYETGTKLAKSQGSENNGRERPNFALSALTEVTSPNAITLENNAKIRLESAWENGLRNASGGADATGI